MYISCSIVQVIVKDLQNRIINHHNTAYQLQKCMYIVPSRKANFTSLNTRDNNSGWWVPGGVGGCFCFFSTWIIGRQHLVLQRVSFRFRKENAQFPSGKSQRQAWFINPFPKGNPKRPQIENYIFMFVLSMQQFLGI